MSFGKNCQGRLRYGKIVDRNVLLLLIGLMVTLTPVYLMVTLTPV